MAGIKQMSDQMGISKGRAKNLMNTAKQMNKGGNAEIMGYAHGGMARIQGTPPAQVKGFTFNDNDGKGTF
jgi:hypothetical protein